MANGKKWVFQQNSAPNHKTHQETAANEFFARIKNGLPLLEEYLKELIPELPYSSKSCAITL